MEHRLSISAPLYFKKRNCQVSAKTEATQKACHCYRSSLVQTLMWTLAYQFMLLLKLQLWKLNIMQKQVFVKSLLAFSHNVLLWQSGQVRQLGLQAISTLSYN